MKRIVESDTKLIFPHLEKIGEEVTQISKILKIKNQWVFVDMFFKSEGKKFKIDEFRVRHLDR